MLSISEPPKLNHWLPAAAEYFSPARSSSVSSRRTLHGTPVTSVRGGT